MLKAYNKIEELDKETLASDPEFLEDASLFLREREGLSPTASPDKVYDAYRKSQIEKLKHNQRLRTTVRAYKALGMDEGDMYRALIKEGALSP